MHSIAVPILALLLLSISSMDASESLCLDKEWFSLVYKKLEPGMWGYDDHTHHAGWYNTVKSEPLPPITKERVMTSYWLTVEQSSLGTKNRALCIACNTNSDGYLYLNHRNNVAAALYCEPDLKLVSIIQKLVLNDPLHEATMRNDTELVALLLASQANVHRWIGGSYIVECARTVDIATLLIAAGALNNNNVRPLHYAVWDTRDPALIPLYRDKGVSALQLDDCGYTPLMELAIHAHSYQSGDKVEEKATLLMAQLTDQQVVELIAVRGWRTERTVFDIIEHQLEQLGQRSKVFASEKKSVLQLRTFLQKRRDQAQASIKTEETA